MDEPIVARDVVRRLAVEAAERQQPLREANPYPAGSAASLSFEIAYWAREREPNGEAYA
jgi:hypothetical protein